jgi:hypothetical protein
MQKIAPCRQKQPLFFNLKGGVYLFLDLTQAARAVCISADAILRKIMVIIYGEKPKPAADEE